MRELQAQQIDLAKHLYETTRCGIAHGKKGIITIDFGEAIANVVRDLPSVKLLARMAIEEHVPVAFRRTRADDGPSMK